MMLSKNMVSTTMVMTVLSAVALASDANTRHYGSNTGGFGSVGGRPGVGGFGNVGGIGGIGGSISNGIGIGGGLGGIGGGLGGIGGGLGGIGGGLGGIGGGLGGYGSSSSGSCRYWCRTPQGQAYCCEGGNEPVALPSVKPGQCPPVRPQCPPVRNFRPPTTCSNDSKCPGAEKCCFDTCLQHHTCKLPTSYY